MADGMDENLGQDEIEKLLQQAGGGPEKPPESGPSPPPKPEPAEDQGEMTENLGQDDIERLLQQATEGSSVPKAAAPSTPAAETAAPPSAANSTAEMDADVQFLLDQAEQALRSVDEPAQNNVAGVAPFELRQLTSGIPNRERASLELLRDVELDMRIELGRTHMYLEDVLQLRKGAVVPLDKLAGDPVDVFVNGRLVARGEVLVLNDNFCVRIAELISSDDGEQQESA